MGQKIEEEKKRKIKENWKEKVFPSSFVSIEGHGH